MLPIFLVEESDIALYSIPCNFLSFDLSEKKIKQNN